MNATQGSAEMPRYRCHKIVSALKIAKLEDLSKPDEETDGSLQMTPAEPGFAPFKLDWEYRRKHKPHVGGYYVVYEDGYKSFSPAEAFESGYTRL